MHGDMDRVTQVFLAPFSKEQTTAYVAKFAASQELNMDQWSAPQFQAALEANPEVADLASSPLKLFMVLTILPSIASSASDDNKREVRTYLMSAVHIDTAGVQ